MMTGESFLADIDAFLNRSGMTATAFGKAAVGDGAFVGDLRRGRQPSLAMVERVAAYIQSQDSMLASEATQ
jgi:hypothetical protein